MFLHLKNLLLICIVALLFAGCAKKDNGKVKITFRLNKVKGIGATLVTYNMLNLDTLLLGKSTLDSNGYGVIETAIEKPLFGHINVQDKYIPLYLKAGDEIIVDSDTSKTGDGVKLSGDGSAVNGFLQNV
jgi:PBP1b-binding outer membrane lipoprotein LpoB